MHSRQACASQAEKVETTAASLGPKPVRALTNCRLAREWKTVTAMVRIYCRDQHGGALCPDCRDLMQYVSLRLDHCRFGEEKPTCARCPVHCYQRDRRQQIKDVMRFAGPKMLWEHPWLSLCHLRDGWTKNQAPAAFESDKATRGASRTSAAS